MAARDPTTSPTHCLPPALLKGQSFSILIYQPHLLEHGDSFLQKKHVRAVLVLLTRTFGISLFFFHLMHAINQSIIPFFGSLPLMVGSAHCYESESQINLIRGSGNLHWKWGYYAFLLLRAYCKGWVILI